MRTTWMIGSLGFTGLLVSAAVSADVTPDIAYRSYRGFVAQLPQAGALDGQISLCMVPGAPVLTANPSIDLAQCSTQSPPVVITPASQLTLGGQCLTSAQVADVGWVLDLEACHSFVDPAQQWSFHGGTLESQGSALCLTANGAATGHGLGAIQLGGCTPFDASADVVSTNLFMPIGYAMNVISTSGWCLTNTKQNYNSDNDDTLLRACADGATSTRADQQWVARFVSDFSLQGLSIYDLTSVADRMALDVFDITSNVGVVDMATPHAAPQPTLRQHWYFTSLGNGSQPGYSLIAHGQGAQCLDIQNDVQNHGTPIDTYLCSSQFGDGDNDAQQWHSVIPGFGQ